MSLRVSRHPSTRKDCTVIVVSDGLKHLVDHVLDEELTNAADPTQVWLDHFEVVVEKWNKAFVGSEIFIRLPNEDEAEKYGKGELVFGYVSKSGEDGSI